MKEGMSPAWGVKYKARVVARGFNQRDGMDYNEIFSPVVRHTSIRVLLAIVTHQDLELEQLDVKIGFLHGDLEEEIYMTQPDGIQIPGKENYVCKLKKSLKKRDIQKLKGLLNAEFKMKDLGAARKILGIEIYRDRSKRKLFLSQKGYIQKILSGFGMSTAKPIDTPSAASARLSIAFAPNSAEENEYMSRVSYASAVGSLMYAMVCTRPNLAQSVSVVSRGDTGCLVTGFSDSDYVGDVDSRRSMTGISFRWDDLDFGPDYAYVTRIQGQQCVLTGPCVRAWYLGNQSFTGVSATHWTPGEILVSMFTVRIMSLQEIRSELTRRFVARDVWDHAGRRAHYLSTLLTLLDPPEVAMDMDPADDVFSAAAVAGVFRLEEVPEGSLRSAWTSDFFDGTRARTSVSEASYYAGESSGAARPEQLRLGTPFPIPERDFSTVHYGEAGVAYSSVETAPSVFTSRMPFDPPDALHTSRETCTDYMGLSGYFREQLNLRCAGHLSALHANEQRFSESQRDVDARVGHVYRERNAH
ncbi:uncharacterized protein [Euphorbia lathyris]|uniref:uncharacterized protein n=1 Tax=Euphorbia lathyris TaxID=212925 RepID=UPI003313A493